MRNQSAGPRLVSKQSMLSRLLTRRLDSKGQALVESTCTFIILLVIAWIPADFGLAFFTSQQVQNAAREGARIAAVDPTLLSQLGGNTTINCNTPCPSTHPEVLRVTAARLSNVMIRTTNVSLTYPDPASATSVCNKLLTVRVQGTYNYTFHQLLRALGVSNISNTATITRTTTMRWEHQTPCSPVPS